MRFSSVQLLHHYLSSSVKSRMFGSCGVAGGKLLNIEKKLKLKLKLPVPTRLVVWIGLGEELDEA